MARTKSVRNLYDMVFSTFPFTGIWGRAMGTPSTSGCWIIWGAEKNGKTWFALLLAAYLSTFQKVLYISAEEGLEYDFVQSCKRAKLDPANLRHQFEAYMPMEELKARLKKRKAEKIVFLDNTTIYADELKGRALTDLLKEFPDVLFVFLAHEEKGQPYTAPAKLCKKLAKVIMHVQGLTAQVSGRCPGGVITVDEHKAELYWGTAINELS